MGLLSFLCPLALVADCPARILPPRRCALAQSSITTSICLLAVPAIVLCVTELFLLQEHGAEHGGPMTNEALRGPNRNLGQHTAFICARPGRPDRSGLSRQRQLKVGKNVNTFGTEETDLRSEWEVMAGSRPPAVTLPIASECLITES